MYGYATTTAKERVSSQDEKKKKEQTAATAVKSNRRPMVGDESCRVGIVSAKRGQSGISSDSVVMQGQPEEVVAPQEAVLIY